jgi:hypothetical protein
MIVGFSGDDVFIPIEYYLDFSSNTNGYLRVSDTIFCTIVNDHYNPVLKSNIDSVYIDIPYIKLTCNSRHFQLVSDTIGNLLVYREPTKKKVKDDLQTLIFSLENEEEDVNNDQKELTTDFLDEDGFVDVRKETKKTVSGQTTMDPLQLFTQYQQKIRERQKKLNTKFQSMEEFNYSAVAQLATLEKEFVLLLQALQIVYRNENEQKNKTRFSMNQSNVTSTQMLFIQHFGLNLLKDIKEAKDSCFCTMEAKDFHSEWINFDDESVEFECDINRVDIRNNIPGANIRRILAPLEDDEPDEENIDVLEDLKPTALNALTAHANASVESFKKSLTRSGSFIEIDTAVNNSPVKEFAEESSGQVGFPTMPKSPLESLFRIAWRELPPVGGINIIEHMVIELGGLDVKLNYEIVIGILHFFYPEKADKNKDKDNKDSSVALGSNSLDDLFLMKTRASQNSCFSFVQIKGNLF